ncbi:PilW family protein [Herminiimonas fonticola]|uniref:Type IV pilus assembly protein PilW n=1 Tax=Herminiimonas fonticola TaxID=303380 RepID=A0A4R6GGB5_9BURK|nr:PilW family protein [Herminiimonas fonticola]RBA24855.1 prepilin-type N-terminal cleavage/methylation domain [Herminiimonas fonticola]TDN93969.1 type IV pilus assembly protein PilW [Herminiimonas fonticola]
MHYSFSTRRNQGFSLVEIMVGVAIGLLGVLIIMQVSVVFEGQKRTTTTGADAQTNGVTALYTVERDVRRAGYGMSVPGALGCTVKRYYDSAPIGDLSLAPVVIANGAAGAPDSIRILSSSKAGWSLPSRITVEHPPQATNIFLNTTLGMEEGDLLVAYEPGKDCTLMQATGIPNGNVQVHHQNTSEWNPPGGSNIFPASGYGVGALVLNLGALIDRTYSLANGNLILADFSSATNTSTIRAIISDIVNMQAEYGFDTRAWPQNDPRVDTWSATMIDADASGTVNDAGDIARVIAVRMAVVARSPLMEKPNASGVCDITIDTAVAGRTVNKPTWAGGDIDVSKNPDGSANANWKCYRYKTFENIIPLRNLLWGQT